LVSSVIEDILGAAVAARVAIRAVVTANSIKDAPLALVLKLHKNLLIMIDYSIAKIVPIWV
tara:strand:+ start:346 stop:528 length:183 start_codon:yes stop_codon:yes gene_type:complete